MESFEAAANVDIEEGYAAYRTGGFHPVYIGDVFRDRYEILCKIGHGQYSTVWLAQDAQREKDDEHKYVALKILSAKPYSTDNDIFERDILRQLRDGNRQFAGYPYICHLLDDFEHSGPNGTHACFVFPLMGETLRSFGAWFQDNLVPYSAMRRFTIQVTLALDYAHDMGIIHTDIQPSNIFVKFRDCSRIPLFLDECKAPEQDRNEERYTPIPSHSLRGFYFSEQDGKDVSEFDVVLGDWGVASWTTKHLTENIQPLALRAPEVLISAPWDTSTDWWNLGCVVLEVYRAFRLFNPYIANPSDTTKGHYDRNLHLAQIVHFFGPFPKTLLDKGDKDIVNNAFCEDGTVRGYPPKLDLPGLDSPEVLLKLKEADRQEFASFLKHVMRIEPSERPDAVEVLKHSWLNAWTGS